MKNISEYVSKEVQKNAEVIWDEVRYKVILFVDNDPVSYVPLDDDKNNFDNALKSAFILLQGGGTKLNNV